MKKAGIVILLLGIIVVTSLACGTVSFVVDPISIERIIVHAEAGDIIEGSFTVRNGKEDIKFYIWNPSGEEIYNAETIFSKHEFQVKCSQSGDYTLYFYNPFTDVGGEFDVSTENAG